MNQHTKEAQPQIRCMAAAEQIADKTKVSKYTAYWAIKSWCKPSIARRSCISYPATVVDVVIKRFWAGDWPERIRR